jgi:hypothetical protein
VTHFFLGRVETTSVVKGSVGVMQSQVATDEFQSRFARSFRCLPGHRSFCLFADGWINRTVLGIRSVALSCLTSNSAVSDPTSAFSPMCVPILGGEPSLSIRNWSHGDFLILCEEAISNQDCFCPDRRHSAPQVQGSEVTSAAIRSLRPRS